MAQGVEAADFDTEIVVLVPDRRRAHLLEASLALLFDSCRDGTDGDAFVDDLVGATSWTRERASRWMADALRELASAGAIEPR